MKAWKKSLAVALGALMGVGMVACAPSGTSSSQSAKDETKAQLYVWNYDGGVGHEWLNAAIKRYEEANKDKVWVEGTKGVQVWVDNKKLGGDAMAATIATSRNQVFFVENLNYLNFAYQGLMLDITDIVEEPLTAYGETQSIADKLTDQQQSYYKLNGTYYALPHYEGFNGISYDRDLFDQKRLFFTDTGEIGANLASPNLGYGVDGKKGTYDDGLPTTYDEFFKLCDKIVSYGMTPISWSGTYQFYFTCMLQAMFTDYAEDEAMMFCTFDGTTNQLIESIAADGTITYKPETKITEENGYELQNHAALYYPLTFAERIIDGDYYSQSSFNGTVSHTAAQDNFILSRFDSTKDIAMLIEGTWWQMEAESTFKMMENTYVNAGKYDRRIGFMPFPKANKERLQSHQFYLRDENYCVRFINANCDEEIIPLAKDFLQFCCSAESLAEFTSITSCTLGYQYQLDKKDYDSLSYFAQSVYDLKQNAKVIYPYANTEIFYKNKTSLTDIYTTGAYNVVTRAMQADGVSAVSFFGALRNKYSAEAWEMMR